MADDTQDWPDRPNQVPAPFGTLSWVLALISLVMLLATFFLIAAALFILIYPFPGGVTFLAKLIFTGIIVLITLPIAWFGFALAKRARRQRQTIYTGVQKERDDFAMEVANILERGETPPPYSLYLRPFFTDGKLTANEGHARIVPVDVHEIMDYGQSHDVERALTQAMVEYAPTISLGRTDDRLGAGRIQTADENWREVFDALIAHATRVFIVPIGQPATMEEIRTIAATPELLAKTIFIRPANRKFKIFNFSPDPSIKSIKGMWEWTRGQVLDLLPEFPHFGRSARFIVFDAEEKPIEYNGNGITSVQLASGIKAFVTKSQTSMADWWLIATLFATSALPAMVYVPFEISPQSSGAMPGDPYNSQNLKQAADSFFFYFMLFIPNLVLGFYKLKTGDLPYRFGLHILPVWLIFIANSVFAGWAIPRAVNGEDFLYNPAVIIDLLGTLNFVIFAYICVVLITNNAARISAILIPVGCCFLWLMSSARGMVGETIGMAVSVLILALAMAMPLWNQSDTSQRIGVIFGAVLASAAAYGLWFLGLNSFMVWQAEISENLADSFQMLSQDAPSQYDLAWEANWGRLWRSMGCFVPVIAFAFAARFITGQGRRQQWADPLDLYPTPHR